MLINSFEHVIKVKGNCTLILVVIKSANDHISSYDHVQEVTTEIAFYFYFQIHSFRLRHNFS